MTSTVDNSSLEIANKLLQQGKIQEAVAEYRRGIELTPDLSWHHYYLGEALTQLEDWEGAVSAYRQAISLGSNYLCYYRLGVALVKLERWDEAIEVLNQGLELKPDYYKFYLPLGQALVHQQHWEPAMEAYRKAVALKPGVAEFNLQLGYLLRRHGRFQEAAGYLQRAVDFQGDDPQLQLALGVALVEGGTDLDRAEGCLRRSLELQPDQGEAYFYLGKLCQGRDQLQEALGFYRRCGELSPGVDSGLAVAAVLEKLGRWTEAVDQYRQVVLEFGECGPASLGLGRALAELERPLEAVVECRRAVKLGVETPEVHRLLADTLVELGRWSEVVEHWKWLLERYPGAVDWRRRLALALMGLGRWTEAAAQWGEYWRVAPGSGRGRVVDFRPQKKTHGEIDHSQELSITGDLTVEFWLYLRDWPKSWTDIISKFVSDEQNEFCFRLKDDQKGQWYYGKGDGYSTSINWVPKKDIRLHEWVHVACVRKVGEYGRIYFNGVLRREADWSRESEAVGTEAPVRLMGSPQWQRFHDGKLSEVRLWNRARSGDEIREGMCEGLTGEEPGLVGLWHGDESDEGVLVDAVGHHHGRLVMAADAGKERPRVGVCGWELSHNAAGRAYTLAQLYGGFAEVELIGCLFPKYGGQVWEPIRGGEIRCHTIRVEDEGRFIEQALGLVWAHPYEVVHLSKPRIANIILGLLYKLVWGARVIVDIDDEELVFVRASETLDLRELPPLRDLDSQEWTEMAAGLAREFDKVRELDGSESRELLAAVVAEVLAVPGCGVSRGLGLLLAGLPSVESVWSELGDKGILEVMDTSEQVETRPEIISCPIVLFTPYYKDKHRARQDELIYCLQKNIDCPEIERIVLLIDDGHEPELQSPKIEIVRLSSRATYLDWVRLTENRFSDRISVLANTDIYLDGSISRLREILSANANAFVALSRHDKEGSQETLHQNPYQSQDVWAVYGKYGFTASLKNDLRIPLGFPRCDNKVAYLFSVHGAKVYNPCHDIKIVHVHETQLRSYDKYGDTTVLGSVAWVYPSASLCQPSKLRISVWTLNPDDVEHLRINKSLISWKKKGKGQQVLESWEDALHRETVTAILERSQERIRQFHNKHLGQRCVIIGNGPSLNEMDLSFLKDEICFGTNKIYLGFERWQFSPTYYVAVNPYVVEQSVNEIRKISCPKFIGNRGIPYFDSGDDMIFIKTFPAPKESFSKRPDLGLNEGCTVTYVAMQLAYYMGFSEVILIGVDHHFVTQGTPHKAIVSDGDDPNHFDPNYFAKGLTWQLPDLANSEKSYRVAKKVFEESGRKIIDATVNGKCQVFPKEDYRFIFRTGLLKKQKKQQGLLNDNVKIAFYPAFDNFEIYADHFYRMLWYLNPIVDSIDKIFIPTHFLEDKLPQNFPDYLDPKSAEFYPYFKNKLIFIDANNTDSVTANLEQANTILLWKTSETENDKIPESPSKKVIKNKKIWRVDHAKERFAGSFYLYCGEQNNKEYNNSLNKSKYLFNELSEKITSKEGFVFGTGPSLSQYVYDFNLDGSEAIACNSMIKNKTLMEYLHPKIIVIADPIFHAGCSTYAAKFRKYLCEALSYFKSYLIVPMRDIHIYQKNLDRVFENQIIGIPFQKAEKPNLNLKNKFHVTTANNILTIFLLPVAATLFDKINILGCDGRPLEENTYFWQHDKNSQINDEMDAIQKAHPGFFSIDYNDYYQEHCHTLDNWISAAENLGKKVMNLTPSYIPALHKRTKVNIDKLNPTTFYNISKNISGISEAPEAPLVSVIIPARNAENTIVDTIKSVQKETLRNWELIVVNDGSTDNTGVIVSEMSEVDRRIRLYEALGEGVSVARNIGLNVAKGKYIGFLDADDLFANDALTKRVNFLDKNPDCSGAYCQIKVVDANLNEFGWIIGSHGRKLTFLDMHGNINLIAVVGKAELLKRQSFEVGRTSGEEDWLYLSQVLRSGVELEYVPDTHVLYLIHPASTVLTKFVSHEEQVLEVIDRIYSYDEKCMEPSPKYRDGLQKPDKQLVLLRRRIGWLTFLLLARNSRHFWDCMQRSLDLPWSSLSKNEMSNNIKRLIMRNYCCASQELWQNKLKYNEAYIRKVFYRFKVNEFLPHYYKVILELCQ